MPIGSIVAVFFVVWWITFVAVLPIGNRSQVETGEVIMGTDPGAPAQLRMGRKLIITTGIAAVLTALLLWGINTELIHHYWNR